MTQTTPTQDQPVAASPTSPAPELGTPEPIQVQRTRFKTSQPGSPEGPAGAGPAAGADQPVSSEPPREPRSTRSGSSQGSSLVDLTELRKGIEATVIGLSGQLHELAARDAYDDWAQIWLADEQDGLGIAAPTSKIINRRTGDITGGNPDVVDGIAIGIAVAFYLVKQLGRLLAAKRARRVGAGIPAARTEPGPPQRASEPAPMPASA